MDKKFIISPSPHIHSGNSVEGCMYGVLIALIPAFLVALYFFGLGALIVTVTSVLACVLFEYLIQKYILKENPEKEKKKTEQPQSTPNNSVEKKRKLSFKERQEMQQLETDMEQLNTEKTIIETALNSGSLSPEELVAQSNRIAEIIAILDEKEMRWLELSEI